MPYAKYMLSLEPERYLMTPRADFQHENILKQFNCVSNVCSCNNLAELLKKGSIFSLDGLLN